MTGAGYEVIGTDQNILFDRGHNLGSLPGSPPRSWAMRVFAHLSHEANGTQVILRWELGPGARLMTVWDVGYLRKEVRAVVATIRATNIDMAELERNHMRAALLSLALYVVSFLAVGVTTVLAGTGEVPVAACLLTILIVAMLFLTIRAPLLTGIQGESRG